MSIQYNLDSLSFHLSNATFFPKGYFSYFVIRFLNQIFFVINFSYIVIRFLLNSSIVKSDKEIEKILK